MNGVLEKLVSKSMLKQRVITAVVLAPLVIALILLGNNWQLASLVALLQFMCGYEWLSMHRVSRWVNVIINLALALLVVYFTLFHRLLIPVFLYVLLFCSVWIPALIWVVLRQKGSLLEVPELLRCMMGMVAVVLFAYAVNNLHDMPQGAVWTLILFVMVWVADTGAYISGKLFGRHKLASVISPGKTWEGFYGGVLLVLFYAIFIAWYMDVLMWKLVLAFPFITIVSVLGDLSASLTKRLSGVKDSSNFLPGHGGFIDRFDSLIAAAPLFFLLVGYIV